MPPPTVEGSPEVTRRMARFLGKFGAILGAENVRLGRNGGEGGIRTLGTRESTTVFECVWVDSRCFPFIPKQAEIWDFWCFWFPGNSRRNCQNPGWTCQKLVKKCGG